VRQKNVPRRTLRLLNVKTAQRVYVVAIVFINPSYTQSTVLTRVDLPRFLL
jgi:hypothetical protein